jgi:hypothetical protein
MGFGVARRLPRSIKQQLQLMVGVECWESWVALRLDGRRLQPGGRGSVLRIEMQYYRIFTCILHSRAAMGSRPRLHVSDRVSIFNDPCFL